MGVKILIIVVKYIFLFVFLKEISKNLGMKDFEKLIIVILLLDVVFDYFFNRFKFWEKIGIYLNKSWWKNNNSNLNE